MLELEGVTKGWQGQSLLRSVALRVAPGETVAILGASGGGKSTLLRLVAGLESPDEGRLLWDGSDLASVPPERRGFALMFQDFALFPHLDVRDNVAFGLVEQGLRRTDARAQAEAMLARFGLTERARARVWTLSGGEQQRVALARALITRPRLLMLDEPFSALDTALRVRLRTLFRQQLQEAGMAALWVTHDEEEARTMATRCLRLVEGRLHEDSRPPATA